ncbi:MAG: 4-(cytidine 5'-diphospho)-2-C-methyl-D-erythritol kinase [Candidatus Omnitrophica bacterium]|nr:4-(cytidine 5'-diphospho)-2-C-methyl-D-erythritol kinase [Candidatus Omnitrophota bacterium]
MSSVSLRSYAKLNLFIKVLRKRPDNFHDLETIFERISLYDDIRLTSNSTGKIKIICSHPQVPKGPKNLVYKVAQMLQKRFGITKGVTITIKKNIPVAAGLAGGSSNGATTLLGLNKIWELKLSQKELVEIGAQVGSDVAFFLYNSSWALGEGRGERITPLPIKAKFWHVVVVPRLKMYSKDVFTRLNLRLTKKGADVNILTLALKGNSPLKAGDLLHNDLETSILSIRPELLRVKNRLRKYSFCGVAFSGSGPACYGLAPTEKIARAAAADLRKHYARAFAVCTF